MWMNDEIWSTTITFDIAIATFTLHEKKQKKTATDGERIFTNEGNFQNFQALQQASATY